MFGEHYSNEGTTSAPDECSLHKNVQKLRPSEKTLRKDGVSPTAAASSSSPRSVSAPNVLHEGDGDADANNAQGSGGVRVKTVEEIIKQLDEEQGVSGPKGGCCSRLFVPFVALALLLGLFCAVAWTSGSGAHVDGTPRVALIVVEGFKGTIFDDMMNTDAGLHLPNIARMMNRRQGIWARCPQASSPDCARAVLVEDNKSQSVYVYSGSSIASILSGVAPALHGVRNDTLEEFAHYTITSKKYPSIAKRVQNAGLHATALGSSHLLSSFGAPSGRCSRPGVLDMECNSAATSSGKPEDELMAEMLECLAFSTCNLHRRKIRAPTDPSVYNDAGALTQFSRQLLEIFGGLSFRTDDQPNAVQNTIADNLGDSLFIFHLDELAVRAASAALPEFAYNQTSKPYVSQAYLLDSLIGQIVNIVRDRARAQKENWLVLGISDHGGFDKSYASGVWNNNGNRDDDVDVVPFFMGTYTSRSKTYVKLRALERPVRQLDVLPTVLQWLDVAPFDSKTRVILEDETGKYTAEEVAAARQSREGLTGKVQGICSSGRVPLDCN